MAGGERSVSVTHTGKIGSGWLLIGFALGGFFDGILLHQILQWHHLLSGLDNPTGSNLRFQILADGLFHLFMYVLALLGGLLLLSARSQGARSRSISEIVRYVLLGFGTWHVIDALVSHWLLGLHRIKMDSQYPLFWDVTWLAAFGIVPIVLAILLPKRGGSSPGTAGAIMGLVVLTGMTAAVGERFYDAGETIVIFHANMDERAMMDAVIAAGSSLIRTDSSGTIWAVDDVSWSGLVTLHARGALLVSATPVLAGCLAWIRTI